jgi:hypothetical protein
MGTLKGKLFLILVLLFFLAIGLGFVVFKFYPYVFAKNVTGEIVGVERVNTNETIVMGGANVPAAQIFSFAVAIRDAKGEIHTASSEDRQWAVVQAGKCAEAKFYPYPPWDLAKWGTFSGARLIRLFDCPEGMPHSRESPAPSAPPAAAETPRVEPAPAPAPAPAPTQPGPPPSPKT